MKNKFLAFLYLAATTLFLTSIYSCSVLAAPSVPDSVPDSAPESSQAHNPQGYTISGTFCFSNATAVPSQSCESSETASRNAIPTTSSLTYSVTATRTSDNFLVNATLTPENKAYTFSNTLSAGTWLITAYGKRGDSIILQSPSKSITLSPSSPYASEDLFMTPAAGNGTVNLTISWETGSGIGYCAYESSIPSLPSGNSGTTAVASLNIQADTVATGTYELTLKFYKDASSAANSIPLYSCTEYVAVYSELTTDSWTSGTAPHISGTNFSVTEDCVKTFVYRKVYVSASGYPAGEATGTSERPFNTMEAAMARLTEVASSLESTMAITESNPWELHVIGTITAPSSFSEASFINVPGTITQLKILGEGSGATIDANSKARVLYISSGANVTIENITLTNGNASENGGGVYVNDSGTFTMESGTITGNNATSDGGGVLVQSGATFNMKGGSITSNTATHAGGLTLLGTFNRQGGTISGNTSTGTNNANNIYIAASANGEFPTGGDNAFYDDTTTSNGKPDAICKITSNQFARFNNPGSGTSDFYSLVCSGSSFFNSSNLVTFYLGNTTDSSGKTWTTSETISPGLKLTISCTSTSDDVKATIKPSTSIYTYLVQHNSAQELLLKKIILDGDNSVRCIYNQQGTLTLENSTITKGGTSIYGAGLYIANGTAKIDADSSITACDNSSVTGSQGGGVYISGGSLELKGKISSCESKNGAGIYIAGGAVTLKDNAIIGQTVDDEDDHPYPATTNINYATENGGGVYINGGAFTMESSSKVSFNYSANHGGGIYIRDGSLSISSSSASVCNNAAAGGGGIFADGATIDLYGSVKKNHGNACGGIELFGGDLTTYSGSVISGNTQSVGASNHYGSGLVIESPGSEVNMLSGTISSNQNYDVSIDDGTFKMKGAAQAGKVCVKDGETIEISDTLSSYPAATITPVDDFGALGELNYGMSVTVLSNQTSNNTKFAVAPDASGNLWGIDTSGNLTPAQNANNNSSDITIIDDSNPYAITGSGTGQLDIHNSSTGSNYTVLLNGFTKVFQTSSSALRLVNDQSSSMNVHMYLSGTNSVTGDNHGGLKLCGFSGSTHYTTLIFDTTSSGSLIFDSNYPGFSDLQIENVTPTFIIADGCSFTGTVGSTTYTDPATFFIAAATNTSGSTITLTRP